MRLGSSNVSQHLRRKSFRFALPLALLISTVAVSTPAAQGRGGAGPPATARASAPKDFTGYWGAVVTEHCHLRMLMPPKNDFSMLPVNA